MKRGLVAYLLVMIIIVMIVGIEYSHEAYKESQIKEDRQERLLEFQVARAEIESLIYHDIYLSVALATYVAANPQSTANEWQPIARALYERADTIRNIGLSPQNVIRYIYPLEGNERALNFDLSTNEIQFESIKEARDTKDIVISGPVDLVQSGKAFIARVPIFELDTPDRYWGGASVVLDAELLFQKSGLQALENAGINFAMRGQNGKGYDGDVFLGDAALFNKENPELVINIPNGSWIMVFEQLTGFEATTPWYFRNIVRLAGYSVIILMVVSAVYSFSAFKTAVKNAQQDSLTGLTNLRFLNQFADMLIRKKSKAEMQFAVMYVDLDGFKQINDQYGHKAGDEILIAVANTLEKNIAKSDVASRVGGDEFFVLFNRLRAAQDLEAIKERIRAAIANTIVNYHGVDLSVSASIGTALFPIEGENLTELMKVADVKMYDDKRLRKAKV